MSNQAAWLPSKGARFEVKEAPFSKPGPGEVLIRNQILAINPVEHKIQDTGHMLQTYPFILGFENAGEIEAVGEGVTRFKKGDRVIGMALALRTLNLAHAGFQLFTVCSSLAVLHIPSNISSANAAVLPIGLATAAAGLYEPLYFGLPAPGAPPSAESSGAKRSILIWGGASVVGSGAIQLSVASGLVVVTTASPQNHESLRSLGATQLFDYKDPDVVAKILEAVDGTQLVGVYDAISGPETTAKSAEVLHARGGGKLLATTMSAVPDTMLLGDVERTLIQAPSPTPGKELPVWMGVWREFFEEGLKDGRCKAVPEPIVIEGGLAKVQEAVDLLKKGVSAAKVMVQL